jgi:hypothetical protein
MVSFGVLARLGWGPNAEAYKKHKEMVRQSNHGRPYALDTYKDKAWQQGIDDAVNGTAKRFESRAYRRGVKEGKRAVEMNRDVATKIVADARAAEVAAHAAPAPAAPANAEKKGFFTKIGRFILPEKGSAIRAFDNTVAAGAVSAGGAVVGGGATYAGMNAVERKAPDLVERLGAAWGVIKTGGTVAGGAVGANLAHRAVSGLKKMVR